ncbi:hypothetical protein TNCV_3883751 [Trichonephila clavipes]|nr:hypothetical protein TNCV_3883751 [Trichonephila clavipes]
MERSTNTELADLPLIYGMVEEYARETERLFRESVAVLRPWIRVIDIDMTDNTHRLVVEYLETENIQVRK